MTTLTLSLPRPHPAQRQVLREARRFNVLACGRRWGKSTMGIELATRPTLEAQPVGWFAPSYKLLLESWRDAERILRPVIQRKNATDRRMELITGGVLEFWTLEDTNAGRSRKYKRVIIDEAGLVEDLLELWQSAIRPTLADLGGDAWIKGTPKGHTDFETLFQRSGESAFPEWMAWQRPTHDNPHIPPEEVAALERELTSALYDQEVLAQFIDATNAERFMPSILWWDACQESMPTLTRAEPLILAADAGVSNDSFGLVGVSRHPLRPDDLAVRLAWVWVPPKDGKLDFDAIQQEIEGICEAWNVAQWCYDPYQLHQMAGSLMSKGIVWASEFGQQTERLEADKGLLDLITTRRVAHDGNAELRQHLDNADRKPDVESRKLRIVKRSPGQKVDLAVAAAMACKRCLELNV